MNKREIERHLNEVREQVLQSLSQAEAVSLDRYRDLCTCAQVDGKEVRVWTEALQRALDEHETVRIPASQEVFWLDGPVLLNSHNRILAHGAVIRLLPGVRTLMLKNRHVTDGSDAPEDQAVPADECIAIEGGRWEESRNRRMGYGQSGCFDEQHSMPGVTTCILLSNVKNVCLRDLEMAHTAGFSIQIGNAGRVVVENIHFVRCYADGVHLNGKISDVLVREISGYVGDDLVALNPYDWDNSGINFGPAERVLIDGVFSDADSPYKAIRIQPGVYLYPRGGESDCFIDDMYLRRVRGIKGYKLYLQTPRYLDAPAHPGRVGRCGNLYFEDLEIDLDGQLDAALYEKIRFTPGYNIFGAFEICSDIRQAEFENIRLTLHEQEYPATCLVSVGPKSATSLADDGKYYEVFDPYASCRVEKLRFSNVLINGKQPEPDQLLRVIEMEYNPDYPNTLPRGGQGKGRVDSVDIS